MARLDIERQKELEPIRIDFVRNLLIDKGLEIISEDATKIIFMFKENRITIFPYSGYFNGKGVKAGRGVNNLIKQL